MTGIRRSNNPFFRGVRPRRFFNDLIIKMRDKAQVTDGRKFNPEWNVGKVAA